jgi:anti-sigma factor RsiW
VIAENELTCAELVELVTDYLEDALPASERARFETHIGTCVGCHNYFEQMKITIRIVGRLTEDNLPAGAKEDLMAAFRTWKQGR